MYYGDEIGLARVPIPPEAMRDPWEKNEPGLGLSRDPSRTPFQWDGSPQAGFSSGEPWLPLDPDYCLNNVAALRDDPRSILSLYRRLIELRRKHAALSMGTFRLLSIDGNVLAYERQTDSERLVIALNFGPETQPLPLPLYIADALVLVSTHLDRSGPLSERTLRGHEGLILSAAPQNN
jgi:alpha-glucosidase